MDISDAFDEISNWEEQLLIEGEELGMERGRELGIEEGRELGMMKGAEIGSEVGFYQGCFVVWNQMLQNEDMRQKINERASKSIVSFGALLEAFELKNIVNDDLLHKLQHIRAKFKVITALLGLRSSLVYNQEDVDAHKNMSF
uniref:Essential protein Yae1 N-terminal domain-containing protein n=1 Tax=Globisporangium ultimum (strain ATCC 200006 / CBS 805.95 / DAOM BR144) TaxID=431595 RepID=K3X9Y7_GLOUD